MEKLSEELRARGLAFQYSGESLEKITDGEKRTVYEGFDPSADSLHVGNLMGLLVLRRYLEAGHKVIVLIGGSTGMIGDPSGKDTERVLLDEKTVAKNAKAITEQVEKVFGSSKFTVVNNLDWLGKLNLIEFLRDTGKDFSVNAMLQRDAVKDRLRNLEQGISYTEFSYMLLQAFDYLHLHKKYGCNLQHGSSDQWGNIASGIDLIRRKTGDTVYGVTHELLVNKTTGKKFGKTEGGAIWLDPEKTSPYQFYQFWFNTDDSSLEDYLKKMTLYSLEEIAEIIKIHTDAPERREGQRALARAVTELVHGKEATESAQRVASVLFSGVIDELSSGDTEELIKHSPSGKVRVGDTLIEALISSGLSSSNRDARELILKGAVSINARKVEDVSLTLTEEDFKKGIALLKKGKRDFYVLYL